MFEDQQGADDSHRDYIEQMPAVSTIPRHHVAINTESIDAWVARTDGMEFPW
jgi:hypothetical protein